jgi:hypothetical protein
MRRLPIWLKHRLIDAFANAAKTPAMLPAGRYVITEPLVLPANGIAAAGLNFNYNKGLAQG